ncbi:MAG: ribulokinase [Bacteroidales bacterium]|nr:MAG: ribulokinase [Bacteroidales bacterium]
MSNSKYVIGIDYGTDSVRSILVDTANGKEIADSVFYYPRWKQGKYCSPADNQFRQHPLDYIEGLEYTIKELVEKSNPDVVNNITAISVDTTGSTPVAVNEQGVPLSMTSGFEENPNAMFVLWKDHTSVKEAEEINDKAKSWGGIDYTMYEGGVYSSEWFWAKILHVLRKDEKVRKAAYSWVEHCDWIPALLTGTGNIQKIKRSRCAAGHKAMWHEKWNGLPSEEFLSSVDPLLSGLREKLYTDTYTVDEQAGKITVEWAEKLGLPKDVIIGVGAFDAHLGAVGGEVKPYYMCKIVGTSTCDILAAPKESVGDNLIEGICGQVDGSVLPGLIGLEAGQSAFGDVYAWFKELLLWPVEYFLQKDDKLDNKIKSALVKNITDELIPKLSEEAKKVPVEESGVLALDWLNGRRTPDANQNLKGAITGLSLGSDAPRVFRALVEATAFGSKAIVERFIQQGVRIDGIIALGGVAKKSDFVMQVLADVLNKPLLVATSEQACALGSAMAASVAGGIYSTFDQAKEKMGNGFEKEYSPDPANAEKYQKIYNKYIMLGKFVENELIK